MGVSSSGPHGCPVVSVTVAPFTLYLWPPPAWKPLKAPFVQNSQTLPTMSPIVWRLNRLHVTALGAFDVRSKGICVDGDSAPGISFGPNALL
jgi:hypothetical protein